MLTPTPPPGGVDARAAPPAPTDLHDRRTTEPDSRLRRGVACAGGVSPAVTSFWVSTTLINGMVYAMGPGSLQQKIQLAILLVTAASLLSLTTHSAPGPCNDSSRLATAEALVHRGTFAIDGSYFAYACDQIQIGGRSYSDKPPLLSLHLAALLALLERTTHWTIPADLPSLYYALTLLSSGLGFLLTLLGARKLLLLLGTAPLWATITAFAAGATTLLLPYSSVISNHPVAAAPLMWFVVLYVLASPQGATPEGHRRGPLHSLSLGLLAGLAIAIDPLVSTVIAPLALVWMLRPENRRKIGWALLGGLPLLVVHGCICFAISGNPLALNLDAESFAQSETIRKTLTGIGWQHASLESFLTYTYHSLFGYRGFFLYNPAALLGCLTLGLMIAQRAHAALGISLGAGLLLFFALSLGFSSNYSGYAYGVRWHAAIAPLVVALGGAGASFVQPSRLALWRVVFIALCIPGFILSCIGTLHPWTTSTSREYSFLEVFSDERPYLHRELTDMRFFYHSRKWVEAGQYAKHLLRRTHLLPEAWRIAIVSAAQRHDRKALERYRDLAERSSLPEKNRRLLLGFIQVAMQQAKTER
jgi:hypothetical protein